MTPQTLAALLPPKTTANRKSAFWWVHMHRVYPILYIGVGTMGAGGAIAPNIFILVNVCLIIC